MTPTPEDIALADSIVRRIANHHFNGEAMFEIDISRRHADLPAAHYTALLIAAHTAPLRERIKELERFATPLVSTTASATSTVIEHESIGTVLGEKLRKKHQEMRELAEIGRLAVERELVWGAPLGDVDGKVVDGIESAMRHDIDAYLAKHPAEKS